MAGKCEESSDEKRCSCNTTCSLAHADVAARGRLAEEGDDSAGKGRTAIEERRKQAEEGGRDGRIERAAEDVHALSRLLNHATRNYRRQAVRG